MRARYSPARGLHLLIYTTTIPHVRHYILHRPPNCRSVRPRQSSSASPCVTTTEQNGKTCFNGYVLCDESKCKCIIYFIRHFMFAWYSNRSLDGLVRLTSGGKSNKRDFFFFQRNCRGEKYARTRFFFFVVFKFSPTSWLRPGHDERWLCSSDMFR